MDDLISRKALMEFANNSKVGITANDIARFPSARQWIPCSERLPDFEEEVLVDYHGRVRLAALSKYDEEYPWYLIVSRFNAKLETVKAWMPLPKAYKEVLD